MQGWGWEGSGRVVGALFVEGASGFVSKEACRRVGAPAPSRSFARGKRELGPGPGPYLVL